MIDLIPYRPLSNTDLMKYASIFRIPDFRGVFMRDVLPLRINLNESGIVNLDTSNGTGTHWVCYMKRGTTVSYFDSYGNLKPPKELQLYFNSGSVRPIIQYNYFTKQKPNTVNCGHLCLDFLLARR